MTGFLDLSTSVTLNDLEPLKKRFLVNFSQFLNAAHISTLNCDEMAGDRPRQPAYEMKAGVKDSYLPKKWLFTAIMSCSVNTVADRHRHAAHHNKHW